MTVLLVPGCWAVGYVEPWWNLFNSSPPFAYICQWTRSALGHRWWLVVCLAPSHYLNQYWFIVNWTLRNKLHWNFNQNSIFSLKKMHLEMSSAKVAAILSRGRWLNPFCIYMSVNWVSIGSQLMACRLFSAKPLPEPILIYCQLDP